MFSATWPDSVKKIADEFLGNNPKKPYHVHVTIGSEQLAANHAVKQVIQKIEDKIHEISYFKYVL